MLARNLDVKTFIITLLYVASLCGFTFTQNGVRKPPSITIDLYVRPHKVFRVGHSVALSCRAEGIPAVKYSWKKNGFHLNLTLPNIHRASARYQAIRIYPTTEKDEGFYQCFATNQYGTALSTVAQIQMAFLERTSQSIYCNIVNMTVPEGRPFVIQAAQRRSFPTPTYNWEITTSAVDTNPRPLQQSRRVQIACNGDLYFAYAELEDELDGKIYKNTIKNTELFLTLGGGYTRLKVVRDSDPLPDFPPNITYFSKSQDVALIGRSIVLKCFFSGKPLPAITWSGPRNVLPYGRNRISSFGTEVTISGIIESDEGDYVCTATNSNGTTQYILNIRVEVNMAPKRFMFSNDNKSLTIRDVRRDCVDRESKTDLMVIQCNASNVHGYAFAQGYLNVLMKTNVTIRGSKHVSIDLRKRKEFVFQCYATSDPSTPSTVRWYKTEPYGDLVRDEPPYLYAKNEFLIIMIDPNCSVHCAKYLGEYRCVGDSGYSRENRTIKLAYRLSQGAIIQKEETWALWKVILGAVATVLVALLIGVFLVVRLTRGFGDVHGRAQGRRMPNPSGIYEDVGYDSIGFPLEEIVERNERSTQRESSMYENVGYASIDQVLQVMGRRAGTMPHLSYARAYSRSESVDSPKKEAASRVEATLDEDDMHDNTEFSIPLREVTNHRKTSQQQINGFESVQNESEEFPKSVEQSGAMNTYSDLCRKEENSYLEPSLIDDNPYMDPCSKEVNPYSNLDMGRKEINPCLGRMEDDTYMAMDKKKVSSYLDMDSPEDNQSLEIGQKVGNKLFLN